ncbi:phytanoyl-CoA dioxygenase family protein [bacterium]|nr:phytanoyl-CoA dioxygenase family protein [bacterium]
MGPLTEDEIRFFKTNGYLIKRGVMDPELCARARERLWDDPPPSMKKNDPDTWVGPIKEEEESSEGKNLKRGFGWRYRMLGKEQFMVDMLPGNEFVNGVAEQLLGKDKFVPIKGVRGIYCTLPQPKGVERKPMNTHVDAHAFNFAIASYIDDVPPDGGGFTVWPRSHRTFWNDFHSRYRPEYGPNYHKHAKEFAESGIYDQSYGGPGDMVFWHHRMGHMASNNYTRQIRKAVICDYRLKNIHTLEEEPPGNDMWVDWSEEVRSVDGWNT